MRIAVGTADVRAVLDPVEYDGELAAAAQTGALRLRDLKAQSQKQWRGRAAALGGRRLVNVDHETRRGTTGLGYPNDTFAREDDA